MAFKYNKGIRFSLVEQGRGELVRYDFHIAGTYPQNRPIRFMLTEVLTNVIMHFDGVEFDDIINAMSASIEGIYWNMEENVQQDENIIKRAKVLRELFYRFVEKNKARAIVDPEGVKLKEINRIMTAQELRDKYKYIQEELTDEDLKLLQTYMKDFELKE